MRGLGRTSAREGQGSCSEAGRGPSEARRTGENQRSHSVPGMCFPPRHPPQSPKEMNVITPFCRAVTGLAKGHAAKCQSRDSVRLEEILRVLTDPSPICSRGSPESPARRSSSSCWATASSRALLTHGGLRGALGSFRWPGGARCPWSRCPPPPSHPQGHVPPGTEH